MSQHLISSTDTPEQVQAALGKPAPAPIVEEQKPAEAEKPAETHLEASEAQEIETETDEVEDGEQEKPDEAGKPKKKSGIQKRIGKLNQRITAAQAEAQYWREQAMKQSPPATQPKADPESPTKSDGKPKVDDFKTHEEWVEAVADWRVEQKLAEREQAKKADEIKTSQQQREQNFFKERESFAKSKDDFEDVMSGIQGIQTSLTVYESVLDAGKNGPELLYELAKDPEEFKRICSLPAIQAAREIGKFEARLVKSEAPSQETKTTKAPKPLKPVGSGAVDVTPTSFESMGFRDYQAWRKKTRNG